MKPNHLHGLQTTAATVVCSRPKTAPAGTRAALGLGCRIGNTAVASWSDTARKSMTVPAFHDRWPLCSTT